MATFTVIESGNNDTAVKSIADKFPAAPRAKSVEDLNTIVKERLIQGPPVSIVQIIGHGAPGLVYVGRTEAGAYETTTEVQVGNATDTVTNHHVLDSNPYVYAALSFWVDLLPAKAEVWLIGCSVGEDPATTGLVEDGPTLLFDLAHTWNRTVRASTGIVTVNDLDETTSKFKDATRLVSVERSPTANTPPGPVGPTGPRVRWNWRVSGQPAVPGLGGTATNVVIELLELRQAPISGVLRLDFVPVTINSSQNPISNGFRKEIKPSLGSLLAAPEYEFTARVDGVLGTAEIMLNGRLLRFRGPAGVRDFTSEKTLVEGLGTAFDQWLRRGLGIPALGRNPDQ